MWSEPQKGQKWTGHFSNLSLNRRGAEEAEGAFSKKSSASPRLRGMKIRARSRRLVRGGLDSPSSGDYGPGLGLSGREGIERRYS